MPDNKRQHYVHQMHLKEWSEDRTNINFVRLSDGFLNNGPINRQCQKPYFFGKDFVTDNLVSLFEGPSKPVLERIVSKKRPPLKWSDDHIDLLMYIMIFSTKTKAEKIKIEQLQQDISELIEQEGLIPPDDFEEMGLPPHEAQISAALKSYPICTDLEMALLVADTNLEFITSDNPVVFYNYWLGHLDNTGHIGLAEKGIMVFMPIDPKHVVVLYDGHRYQAVKERQGHIVLDSESVLEVNALQVFSAENAVYFKSGSESVSRLVATESGLRNSSPYSQILNKQSNDPGDYRIEMPKNGPPRKMKFDFFNLKYCARQRGAARKALENGNLTRNEDLVRATELFRQATWEINYPVTEFKRFMREYML